MPNPQKGEVELKVGDRVYTMRLGHNARAEAEGLLDRKFSDIMREFFSDDLRHETLRAVVWAALHQFHPELSLFDVGDILDEAGDTYVGGQIGEALRLSAPKSDPKRPPRKAKSSKAGATA